MVPPKKDAFADLFQSATGSSSKASPSSSLQNLSLGGNSQPKKPNPSTFNFDVLSPTNHSPSSSKPQTPLSQVPLAQMQKSQVDSDPFAIFGASSSSPAPKVEADDPFAFFTDNSTKPAPIATKSAPTSQKNQQYAAPKPQNSTRQDALLDDEFTDAFVTTEETRPVSNSKPRPESRSSPSFQNQEIELRDSVLATLISEGISIDVANRAISRVGPDYGRCLEYIGATAARSGRSSVSSRNSESSRDAQRANRDSPFPTQKELGETLHELSSDMYKKASWLFDKSKKTVIKNINNYQNQRRDDSMPAWIKQQHRYKGQASELKEDGTSYEDFGDDEDNIDAEEIQRIVREQRQREMERQRQRLEKKTPSPNGTPPPETAGQRAPMPGNATPRNAPRQEKAPRQPARPQASRTSTGSSEPVRTAPRVETVKAEKPDSVDLLGLGGAPLSRAEMFKKSGSDDSAYVSKSRRRAPAKPFNRPATAEQLNAFQQSDYETSKAKGGESFSNGDFGSALEAYTRCLESLPPTHELRIVISANLALTAIKLGDYKLARDSCDSGISLIGDCIDDDQWIINDKPAKYWFTRLLSRKAESLEMMESFESSLECYMALVSKYGVNDKKIMDAKRRVNNIVNPPKPVKKVAPKPAPQAPVRSEKLDRVKNQHLQEKLQEEQRFKLHDQVHERIQQWSHGKEDNLRTLLMSLNDVLPQRLGFSFLQKPLTINDLMLTKKVKINYMKVISNIHPDKLGSFELEDQMVCQAVFVALNKAWDSFKEQNNIA